MTNSSLNGSYTSALVLDDDDFSQEITLSLLEQMGFTDIRTASDGREGLAALADSVQLPDVIICDVLMPGMDGADFLVALSKMKFDGKVILVSGIDQEILAIAKKVALGDGLKVAGALTKPIKKLELSAVLGFHQH